MANTRRIKFNIEKILAVSVLKMAGKEGYDPSLFGSKPKVLPLNYSPILGGGGDWTRTNGLHFIRVAI